MTKTRIESSNPPKSPRSLPSGKVNVKHLSLKRRPDKEVERATAVHEEAEVDVVAAIGVRKHCFDLHDHRSGASTHCNTGLIFLSFQRSRGRFSQQPQQTH